jgi:hypothetical protein
MKYPFIGEGWSLVNWNGGIKKAPAGTFEAAKNRHFNFVNASSLCPRSTARQPLA